MRFSNNLPEWCTSEFLSMCHDTDNMKKRQGNQMIHKIYYLLHNTTVKFGKELRKTYFRAALNECGTDSKKL